MDPIDFGSQRSKVKVTIDMYGNKLVNRISTKPLCASSSNFADMLTMLRRWTLLILEVTLTNVGCTGMLRFALLYFVLFSCGGKISKENNLAKTQKFPPRENSTFTVIESSVGKQIRKTLILQIFCPMAFIKQKGSVMVLICKLSSSLFAW